MAGRGTEILKSISILPVLLLIIELVVRTTGLDAAALNAEPEISSMRTSKAIGWERTPGFRGIQEGARRRFGEEGLMSVDWRQAADTDVAVALFIGGSNTFGYRAPAESTFVEVVDRAVPGVAAINLGEIGYSSYQALVMLERSLTRFRPALVVLDVGFNDRRWVPADGTDEPSRFARQYASDRHVAKRIVRALSFWHSIIALESLIERVAPPDSAAKVDRLDRVMPRVDESQFRENLAKIVALARAAGATVLFVHIPDEPTSAYELDEGVALFGRGQYDSAVAHLRRAVAEPGFNRDLSRIYLSRALRASGDSKGAEDALRRTPIVPELDGVSPVRLDSTYFRILRQVSDSLDVAMFDASSALDAEPGSYADDNHLSIAGHHRLGLALAPVVADLAGRALGER